MAMEACFLSIQAPSWNVTTSVVAGKADTPKENQAGEGIQNSKEAAPPRLEILTFVPMSFCMLLCKRSPLYTTTVAD